MKTYKYVCTRPFWAIFALSALLLALLGGGERTSARELQELTYNPSFAAEIGYNQLHNWNWGANAALIWTIDDPDTPQSPDHTQSGTTDSNGYILVDTGAYDIQPNDLITASDGLTQRTLTVEDLSIGAVDIVADTVSGSAPANRPLSVSIWSVAQPWVATASDGGGAWSADFSGAGGIGVCDSGAASLPDGDGDATWHHWFTPCPSFKVQHDSHSRVDGWGWQADAALSVTFDDPDTGPVGDASFEATCDAAGNFNLDIAGYDIQPDDLVTVTDTASGEWSKGHTVTHLWIDSVDVARDNVSGSAVPGSSVKVYIDFIDYEASRTITVDGNGRWAADFSGVYDIQPDTTGHAEQMDADYDATQANWWAQELRLESYAEWDQVEGYGWPNNALVTLEIDDPDSPQDPDYTNTYQVGPVDNDPFRTYLFIPLNGVFDIQPGFTVRLADGANTRSLTLTDLEITHLDFDLNLVSGAGQPGVPVDVWFCVNNPDWDCNTYARQVTPADDGSWSADFSDPAGGNLHDLQPNDDLNSSQADGEGDKTRADWHVPNVRFSAEADENNDLLGWHWPAGSILTLQVDSPSNGTGIDYQTSTPVNPDNSFKVSPGAAYDLQVGDLVIASDASFTKRLVISGNIVTGTDENTDTVSGTGTPGRTVAVRLNWTYPELNVTVGDDNAWSADFTGQHDLAPGDSGNAEEYDDDLDGSIDTWRVPHRRIIAWPGDDYIQGEEWSPGAWVTLTIEDPGTPLSPDYTAQRQVGPSPWDPNYYFVDFGLYRIFDLQPGQLVTLSGEGVTKSLTLTGLEIRAVDYGADTVSGWTDSNLPMNVSICVPGACYGRNPIQDIDGNWGVDFAHSAPEDDKTRDILYSDSLNSYQTDPDGDEIRFDWRLPVVQVHPDDNWIEGWNWPNGELIALTVDDPGTPQNPDFTGSATVGAAQENNDPHYFVLSNLNGFDLKVGQVVTAFSPYYAKTHTITSLLVEGADADDDLIWGTAAPGSWVNVDFHTSDARMEVQANGSGAWSADFTGQYDAQPGENGRSHQRDEDDDWTADDWRIPKPYIDAWTADDQVQAKDWPLGTLLTLTIDDPDSGPGVDHTAQATVSPANWDPSQMVAEFNLYGLFDLQSGQFVTVSNGTDKTLTLSSLRITEVDVVNDTVSGKTDSPLTVRVWICDQSSCTNRNATPDADGNWAVDFGHPAPEQSSTRDIQPADHVGCAQTDSDGDETMFDWRYPNLQAHPDDNWIEGWNWPTGDVITITVDIPSTPAAPDFSGTAIAGADPGNHDPHFFALWNLGGFDLQAGHVVTATNGVHTKTHTVTTLVTLGIDPDQDAIWGTAEPGSWVRVEFHNDPVSMDVQADGNGAWIADFTGLHDAVPGNWGRSRQSDTDDDWTADDWHFPNPNVVAEWKNDNLWGADWTPGAQVQITINNPNNGPSIDYSGTTTVEGNGWFNLGLWDQFDILPGFTVTATDGTRSKSLLVTRLQVTGIDADLGIITGETGPGGQVHVWINKQNIQVVATADGNGNWSADFSSQGGLQPGMEGYAEEYDLDNDRTHSGWWIPKPFLDAWPRRDSVYANDWPEGALLFLSIDDPATPQNPDYRNNQISAGCPDGNYHTCVEFGMAGVFELTPGMLVSLTDNTTTKTLTVSSVTYGEIDETADTISGTSTPLAWIHVDACLPESDCTDRIVQADGNGAWIADFSTPWGGHPALDIQPGAEGKISERDVDEDFTSIAWRIRNPQISARPYDDYIEGYNWPHGTPITLTIDDPATPANPDYTETGYMRASSWDDKWYYVPFELRGAFDLKGGQLVTLSGGGLTRSLTVSQLYLASVDIELDALSGTAALGSSVITEICSDGCTRRQAVAGPDGSWTLDFSQPGPGQDNPSFDIGAGSAGDVFQSEGGGNETRLNWTAPYTPYCLPGTSVMGHVYRADGATPVKNGLVTFELFDLPNLAQYRAVPAPDGSYGCALPPGTYRIYASGDEYSDKYYDDAIFENATPVVVTPGSSQVGVDFTLDTLALTLDHLTFNLADPIVGQIAVRQAIAYGIDRQRIINAVFPASPLLDSFLPPEHWAYTSAGVIHYAYNPELAEKILEQAGWVDTNGDNVQEKDGLRLRLEYVTTTAAIRKTVSDIFVENMAAIGIEVNVNAIMPPWQRIFVDHDFSVAQFAWIPDPNSEDPLQLGSQFRKGEYNNASQYDNPTADQMLFVASLFGTRAEKLPFLEHHQRIVMADLVELPLFQRHEITDRDGDGVPDEKDTCPEQSSSGYDVDGDGCLDSPAALKDLINKLFSAGEIKSATVRNKLLAQVVKVETELGQKDYPGALTELNNFINLVNSELKKKTLTQTAADKLNAYANGLKVWVGDLDNLRLGALLELSGEIAGLARTEDQGMTLAIEQANAAGGVLGGAVLLDRRDAAWDDPAAAQSAASNLATNRRAQALIGPVASPTLQEVLESVIVPAGVVDVSPSSTAPHLALIPDNGLLFRIADSDATRGLAAGLQACNDGYQTAAIIIGETQGDAIEQAFRDEFSACSGQVLATAVYTGDAGAALRQALGSDPNNVPEMIFVGIYFNDDQVLDLTRAGMCVIGPDNLRPTQHHWSYSSRLPDDFVPKVFENLYCWLGFSESEFAGYTSLAPSYESDFGSGAFATAYQARFGQPPDALANTAYDAAALVILAAEQAGSADPALIKTHLLSVADGGQTVSNLSQALALVRSGVDIDWDGTYAGSVGSLSYPFNHAFQADGESIGVYLVWRLAADGTLNLESYLASGDVAP